MVKKRSLRAREIMRCAKPLGKIVEIVESVRSTRPYSMAPTGQVGIRVSTTSTRPLKASKVSLISCSVHDGMIQGSVVS